jgi:outer membrane lipoprotein-sorting protein
MVRVSQIRILVLALLLVPSSGCLFRSRKVERQVSNAALQTATQEALIAKVNEEADKIKTLQATVDIDTSVANLGQGTVTDYKEIRGYVLLRKPAMLRMIGLMPIVRNKAFDMVSDGREFKVWIPAKNRFVVGRNDAPLVKTKLPIENMRPQDIYDALLIQAVDPQNEIAVVENGYETVLDARRHQVEQPDYELVVIRHGQKGWFLSRRIVFSRTDLQPHRQLIYDEDGQVRTEAHYEKYTDYDQVSFPAQVVIVRPTEGYDITLSMVKLEINKPLTNEQFELEQPAGADVVHLGHDAGTATAGADGNSAKHR